tara:strand:- start:231 stop:641 length:411 start_codon:yes stop_codon:yes gene_type:complete
MGGCFDDLFKCVQPCAKGDGLKLAKKYWPGALTIVLPTIGNFAENLNCQSNYVGFRVPALGLARDLLMRTGPLATTSANISGESPANDEKEASSQFPGIPILAPVPWPCSSGVASTVVKWENGKWNLLRPGSVVIK